LSISDKNYELFPSQKDKHEISTARKQKGGASRGIPFAIDFKGGEREVEHNNRESSMMIGEARERKRV